MTTKASRSNNAKGKKGSALQILRQIEAEVNPDFFNFEAATTIQVWIRYLQWREKKERARQLRFIRESNENESEYYRFLKFYKVFFE